MRIDSHAYLFFRTAIKITTPQKFGLSRHFGAATLEDISNLFLETDYSLLGRENIGNIERKIFILRKGGDFTKRNPSLLSILLKVIRVFAKIFFSLLFTIPSLSLKAFVWAYDFSFVKKRNELIFEALKQQEPFFRMQIKSLQLNQFKPTLSFKELNPQENCPLLALPQEVQALIWKLLDETTYYAVGEACKKSFASIRKTDHDFTDKDYPKGILKAFGNRLKLLPFGSLEPYWHDLINNTLQANSTASNSYPNSDHFSQQSYNSRQAMFEHRAIEVRFPFTTYAKNQEFRAVERILCPQGRGVRLRLFYPGARFSMIFLKIKEKWTLFTDSPYPLLSLFLNDLCFHEDVPLVEDYLKRLLEGKTCSYYFDYPSKLHNIVDYEKGEKASEKLVEKPKEHSVQLWPSNNEILSLG